MLCCSATPRNAATLRVALLRAAALRAALLLGYASQRRNFAALRVALLLGCSVASRLFGWLWFVNTQQSANCALGDEIPVIAFWVSAIKIN